MNARRPGHSELKNALDELRLAISVRLPVVPVPFGQGVLQPRIFLRNAWVRPQVVPKKDMPRPQIGPDDQHMHVLRPVSLVVIEIVSAGYAVVASTNWRR